MLSRELQVVLIVGAILVLHAPAGAHDEHDPHAAHRALATGAGDYTRREVAIDVPDVSLVDQSGAPVALAELLSGSAPIALNFIFATCTTVCPIASTSFADLRQRIGVGVPLRLVSITIDPEHDNPGVLREYAARYGARPDWRFLTGDRADVERVLRAFDSYVPNKMSHTPKTFLRAPGAERWIRIDGFMGGEAQAAELRRIVPGD